MAGWCACPPDDQCKIGWYRAISTMAMFGSVPLLLVFFLFLFFYAIVRD